MKRYHKFKDILLGQDVPEDISIKTRKFLQQFGQLVSVDICDEQISHYYDYEKDDFISTGEAIHKLVQLSADRPTLTKYTNGLLANHKDTLNNLLQTDVTKIELQIRSHRENMQHYIQRYKEQADLLRKTHDELYLAQRAPKGDIIEFIEKFKENFPTGFFTPCSFDEHVLYLATQPIELTYNETRVNLGRFLVSMDFKKLTDVTASTSSRVERGLLVHPLYQNSPSCENQHPHVNTSGYVCWGEGLEMVVPLFEERDYTGILKILIGVLTQYNSDSPYQSLYSIASSIENNGRENNAKLSFCTKLHSIFDFTDSPDLYSNTELGEDPEDEEEGYELEARVECCDGEIEDGEGHMIECGHSFTQDDYWSPEYREGEEVEVYCPECGHYHDVELRRV